MKPRPLTEREQTLIDFYGYCKTLKTSKANVCRTYAKRASGRRIAQDIDAIRTALKLRSYSVRKQPQQAAWAVYVTDDKFYLLDLSTRSYQRLGASPAG